MVHIGLADDVHLPPLNAEIKRCKRVEGSKVYQSEQDIFSLITVRIELFTLQHGLALCEDSVAAAIFRCIFIYACSSLVK
jgi:hypothetical protein